MQRDNDSWENFLEYKQSKEEHEDQLKEARHVSDDKGKEETTSSNKQQNRQTEEVRETGAPLGKSDGAQERVKVPVAEKKKPLAEVQVPMGGNVALRHTAPAHATNQKGQKDNLRNSAPGDVSREQRLAMGSASQVSLGSDELGKAERAPTLQEEQLRYVLGGEEALVVGGTSGIGLAIARELASYGCFVTVMGRREIPKKSKKIAQAADAAPLSKRERLLQLREEGIEAHIRAVQVDLRTVAAQKKAVADLPLEDVVQRLNLVVFSIGTRAAPGERLDNGNGVEMELAVSYVSRRVILDALLERGLPSTCRVFVLNECGKETSRVDPADLNGERAYRWKRQHEATVACNDALVLGARQRHPQLRIWGLNPGVVDTDLRNAQYRTEFSKKLMKGIVYSHAKTPEFYAARAVHLLGNSGLAKNVFAWDSRARPVEPSKFLKKAGVVDQIWEATDKLIQKSSN